ncbi:MAG TPA: cystathionine gamma-synthase family protein [Deltaproteobacteria bacterium]|nr:cystathionine gamma-synthase family protein [Deltaproteobacteria bacterium]
MRERKKGATIAGRKLRPESLMMSYGYDPKLSEGAVKSPIFQTSTFVFESAEAGKAFFEVAYGLREQGQGEALGLIYSRLNNPDLEILEDRLTLWDDAEACAVFQSGMAAIATALLAYVRPGDVLLHSEPLYGGSDHLVKRFFPELKVEPVGFLAGTPPEELETSLRQRVGGRHVSAVLIETPANPTNALVDIATVSSCAARVGRPGDSPVVMVDNTFLGPLWQHPLEHGADLVVYSATKFLGGHSDVIAGACLGSQRVLAPVRALRTFLGTMADPWTGWLLLRSLETLSMRMTAQMKNARNVAEFLNNHPKVRRVYYLDLLRSEDPTYAIYRRQCLAPGSVISFDLDGGEAEAFRFLNHLKLVKLAVSLGGTESLAEHPASMTHADVPAAEQRRMGVGPAMVRLSVGVEHYEDIITDLGQALEAV